MRICDVCKDEDAKGVDSETIVVGGSPPWTLQQLTFVDLCARDLGRLRSMVENFIGKDLKEPT